MRRPCGLNAIVTVHGKKWRNKQENATFSSTVLFFVVFMRYELQIPCYFIDFVRLLARERLHAILRCATLKNAGITTVILFVVRCAVVVKRILL